MVYYLEIKKKNYIFANENIGKLIIICYNRVET